MANRSRLTVRIPFHPRAALRDRRQLSAASAAPRRGVQAAAGAQRVAYRALPSPAWRNLAFLSAWSGCVLGSVLLF
jgi:hypothetical protein